jgi:hypothetical protein
MIFPYEEFDLSGVRTYPLAARKSKANTVDFAQPVQAGATVASFVDALPNVLAAADLKAIVAAIVAAKRNGGGVLWGIGAHVIKTGLAPVLIDLMERGFVSGVATNGATVIHDFEVALAGSTSEDVDQTLGPGQFGMAEETGRLLNQAITDGVDGGMGLGEAVVSYLHGAAPPFARASLLCAAGRLGIPITVHVAVGTDVVHMHPAASGRAIGEGSLKDFRYLAGNVARLDHGVYLNCGSAVILPEVFLKAVALARNGGVDLPGLTTVNLDFARMYRPQTNVVVRPTAGTTGHGYSLIGHHEIMIPLLAACVIERDART